MHDAWEMGIEAARLDVALEGSETFVNDPPSSPSLPLSSSCLFPLTLPCPRKLPPRAQNRGGVTVPAGAPPAAAAERATARGLTSQQHQQ